MGAVIVARVRGLMEAQGLTQNDLAEKSGVDPTYISRMMRAPTRISVETLIRLADGLGVTASSLLPDAPAPRVDPQSVALRQIGESLADVMERVADLSDRVGRVISAHPPANRKRPSRKR